MTAARTDGVDAFWAQTANDPRVEAGHPAVREATEAS